MHEQDTQTPEVNSAQGPTKILFGDEARAAVLVGIEMAGRAVGATMGPGGRTVIIENKGKSPTVTKDGVTVCGFVNPRDPFAKLGADLVKEAAQKTNDTAGDGTTTASVLASALCTRARKHLSVGVDPVALRTGYEKAAQAALEYVEKLARPVKTNADLAHVARISANGDTTVGDLVARALARVGAHGIVTVEESRGVQTELEVVAGTRIDRGYASPYFVTSASDRTARLESPYVFLTERKITSFKEILPILEHVNRNGKPLLLIADDYESDVLQALVLNKTRGGLKVCAIKAPAAGVIRVQLLEDIATLTGGSVLLGSDGWETLTHEKLGQCETIIVDAKRTTFIRGKGSPEALATRVSDLTERVYNPTLTDAERNFVRNRLAGLTAGIGVIKVGGYTDVEIGELKHRIEDALNAALGAAAQGVVPGGGRVLQLAAGVVSAARRLNTNEDEALGMAQFADALLDPPRRILENAGVKSIVFDTEDEWSTYDIAKRKAVNAYDEGLLDSVRVTLAAIANATSVAKAFVSLDVAIVSELIR